MTVGLTARTHVASALNGKMKSELRMTASVLQPDPSTQNVKKNAYLM